MTGELDYSLPPAVRRIASAFRLIGWISFWAQVVLSVVSTFLLLFAISGLSFRQTENSQASPGTGAGLLFAGLALAVVFFGVYWAFRYTRLARQLRSSQPGTRPKPKDAVRAIQVGLIASLVGMLLTQLGAGAIVGALIFKSFEQPTQGGVILSPTAVRGFITSFDLLIVQANTNTSIAHFVGIVASLWLSRAVNRQ
ncbi:MAG: DUF3611 family protein [Leptolyngbyaceae cyanobacterium RM1_1_2]|nr:DUF3611 family protein [Leptolyngbyaceae cyanobacterium RM1_1_2]